jgi:uncharacterized protein (DUF1778 family)
MVDDHLIHGLGGLTVVGIPQIGRSSQARNDRVITTCDTGLVLEDFMGTGRVTKRDTLNIRIKPELRGLIDRAARLRGKNRTDFVLDAARQAAEDALLDRTIFAVDSKAYNDFLMRLDAPPRPNDRLRRTLRTPPPWAE